MEGKLDQILLLGWGHENWTGSQHRLAAMSNYDKVKAAKKMVLESDDFARVHTRPEWCTAFNELIQRLHCEREFRNSLVHSEYLFHFVELGHPPMKSDRRRNGRVVEFDNTDFSNDLQEKFMLRLGKLSMDVNFTHVQLVADYKAAC
ncbi:MAG: hypothetical protein Q7T86_01650 [Hyphomicrobiaceae bacterium]|nr:hypothetical protein [Hyphomicrobiaceae bacterium]